MQLPCSYHAVALPLPCSCHAVAMQLPFLVDAWRVPDIVVDALANWLTLLDHAVASMKVNIFNFLWISYLICSLYLMIQSLA